MLMLVGWDDRVEKYRPVSLDDVVSHKDITSTSMPFFAGNICDFAREYC